MKTPWFTFLDHDDKLSSDALQVLISAARPEDDMVRGCYSKEESELGTGDGSVTLLSDPQSELMAVSFTGIVWRCIWKTEKFSNIPFELRYHEDTAWSAVAYQRLRHIREVHRVIYWWRQIPTSTSHNDRYYVDFDDYWRYVANKVPQLKEINGQIAYSLIKKHLTRSAVNHLYSLQREGVISFRRLSYFKRLKMRFAYLLKMM